MDLQQILAWVQAGQVLYSVGAATVANIRTWIKSQNPAATEAELNAICDVIIAGATKHKALADLDAAGPPTAA
jgi:ABC-type antimicrobial peptide transport system ATPase subunit